MDEEFEDALETMLDLVDFPEFSMHEGRDEILSSANNSDATTKIRRAQSTSTIGMEAKDDLLDLSHIRRRLHSRLWGPRHILMRDKLSFLLGCTMLW